jgi:hypothetical protein
MLGKPLLVIAIGCAASAVAAIGCGNPSDSREEPAAPGGTGAAGASGSSAQPGAGRGGATQVMSNAGAGGSSGTPAAAAMDAGLDAASAQPTDAASTDGAAQPAVDAGDASVPTPGTQWALCEGDDDCTAPLVCMRSSGLFAPVKGSAYTPGYCTHRTECNPPDDPCPGLTGSAQGDCTGGVCLHGCEVDDDCPAAAMTCKSAAWQPAKSCEYAARPGDRPAYAACTQSEACIGPDTECAWGYCAPRCREVGECPQPGSGNAVLTCQQATCVDDVCGTCRLSCGDGETCPNGMQCALDQVSLTSWCRI